jgi:hypothetical protein
METLAVAGRETALAAMWHAYRAAISSGRTTIEFDPSIEGALLNARYYNESERQLITEDLEALNVLGVQQHLR